MSSAIAISGWRILGNLVAALLLALPVAAGEAPDFNDRAECSPPSEVTQLATETATAGTVANILNRTGSIRATSNRMLASALESARSKDPIQWIVFTSMPELSKKSADDDPMCVRLEQATKKDPLKFEDRQFDSADALTNWITEFTQGKGADGKSLYEQCPGKCSPRYTWLIEPQQRGMKVDAWVVCGRPRDRDGNQYHLTTALARAC